MEPSGNKEGVMKPLISVALVCSAAIAMAGAARAQAVHADGADPAPGAASAYVGADKATFYDVEARIDAAMQQAPSKRAAGQLRALKSEANFRRQRHGGELRDWDRELLSRRLDQIMGVAVARN